MQEHSELVLFIVVIIHAERDRSEGRMHHQTSCTCKVEDTHVLPGYGLLVKIFLQILDGFKDIRFQPEVKPVSQGENVAETTSHVVKCPEIIQ